MRGARLRGHVLRCLAHYLQVADDGVLRADVRPEMAFAVLPEEQDALHSLEYVAKVEPIVLHKAKASVKTRSRM